MLKEIIDNINIKINELNVFNKLFGICEIITDDVKFFPAYWSANNYTSVSDFKDSLIYHRINGEIRIEQNEEETTKGCSVHSIKSIPMRAVIFLKKDSCIDGIDNEENIAFDIEKKISTSNSKELSDLLNAENVSVTVNGFIFDRNRLYRDEYNSTNKIGFEYSYLAIEYTIEIRIDLNCQTERTC